MAVVVAVVLVAVLAACGGNDDVADDRAARARDAAVEAGLDADVADFVALAARGARATFQATYPGQADGTQLVIASEPPNRRVDFVVNETVNQVDLVIDDQAYRCVRTEGAVEVDSCERTSSFVSPVGTFDDGALEDFTEAIAAQVDAYEFTLETVPVAGVEARCLQVSLRAGVDEPGLLPSSSVCVSPEGVLLRYRIGDESVEATDYTTDVPDGSFVLPDAD